MANRTIYVEVRSTPGETIATAVPRNSGTGSFDVGVAPVAIAGTSGKLYRVACVYDDASVTRPAGDWVVIVGAAESYVTFSENDDEYTIGGNDAGTGSTLTGPNELTVTILDDDTDEPIEAAIVRVYRTGATGSEPTNDQGVAVLGRTSATWKVLIAAEGYESLAVASLEIASDVAKTYRLASIVLAASDDPERCNVTAKVVDQHGVPIEDAIVTARLQGKSANESSGSIVLNRYAEYLTGDDGRTAAMPLIKYSTFDAGGTYDIRIKTAAGVVTIEYQAPDSAAATLTVQI